MRKPRPPQFDAERFLRDRWRSPDDLTAFLHSYGHTSLQRAAVNQWFRRGRVPTEWGMTLLALVELETGRAPTISQYLS